MTSATAAALAEASEHLYECFGGYHDRLAKEQRPAEDQAVFAQLFSQNVRQVRPEMLVRLMALFRLPKHHYGTLELKHLLPRLCEISLGDRPLIEFSAVTEMLGRFKFDQWPTAERTAVWDYLLLRLRALLEEFAGRQSPPWGAYGYFRDLSRATEHVQPALLLWEMADFVTADLHLAAFASTWIEDRPLRERQPWGRAQMDAISRWLYATGREKLALAALIHIDSPFKAEIDRALLSLGERPTPKSIPPRAPSDSRPGPPPEPPLDLLPDDPDDPDDPDQEEPR